MTLLADISETIDIAASQDRVWRCLTQEGLVDEWLGCMNFSPRIGAVFHMQPDPARRAAGDVTGATHCEVLAIDEPRLFAFSWFVPGTPATRVEITLEAVGERQTRARLVHSGWDQFKPEDVQAFHEALSGGWKSFVLPGLKRVAEAA